MSWLSDLFGKSQSWYNRVDKIQKDIAVLVAQVNAVGQPVWDAIFAQVGAMSSYPPGLSRFTDFSWTTNDLIQQQKNVLITKSKAPSDEDLANAESRVGLYQSMVDYATSIAPEVRAQVAADAEQIRAALAVNSLMSPAVVGVQAFEDELERRSKILGGSSLAIGFVLAAIAVAAWGFAKGGRR